MIVTSEVVVNAVSDAVSRSTYEPAIEKLAVVLSAFALPNVTVPGTVDVDLGGFVDVDDRTDAVVRPGDVT